MNENDQNEIKTINDKCKESQDNEQTPSLTKTSYSPPYKYGFSVSMAFSQTSAGAFRVSRSAITFSW